jgi:2'-5' RNA ligase
LTRLFSAIVPPRPVLAHLAERAAGTPLPAAVRRIPDRRWHVTLGFFGDDDVEWRRADWLRRRLADQAGVRLRLAGAGTFAGVLWIGVRPEDELDRLARAGGAGSGFRPHLSLARWGAATPDRAELVAPWHDYAGPEFAVADVRLLRSEHGPDGPVYTEVDRFPLASG